MRGARGSGEATEETTRGLSPPGEDTRGEGGTRRAREDCGGTRRTRKERGATRRARQDVGGAREATGGREARWRTWGVVQRRPGGGGESASWAGGHASGQERRREVGWRGREAGSRRAGRD